ncbi:hypothetical protein [Allopontixanthobacter sediminis]|uniref:Uncharacterized protein n=1 Tax=Allopontixanthobacter sediminis TaxID=1689985 RepID=A0A845B1B5_9SPHN|nr:hypothetical protein [Allopontixanthobacter sediminis]MXP44230.1 hypothetical protein [Allopontixanthobacter sediminis]
MIVRSLFARISLPAVAALSVLAVPAAVHAAQEDKQPRNAEGEAELAKLLEGRTMGEPRKCLGDSERRNMQVIDDTAFVFRDGDTLYVNRPDNASFLDEFDVPVFRVFGSELCRLDQVEMRSRGSGIGGPVLILQDFIPYTREKESSQ